LIKRTLMAAAQQRILLTTNPSSPCGRPHQLAALTDFHLVFEDDGIAAAELRAPRGVGRALRT
jgi:DeoR/GlpR family transcriptional regulator of sugar metabolism